MLDAFKGAGLGTASLIDADELLEKEITIFKDYIRIDVQTSTQGLKFERAWNNRVTMRYNAQEFYVVSQDDLILSKRAAGRDVDLEDVRLIELGKMKPKKES